MATSIPSAFSYEMLSRLPANSFLLQWVEVRPDQVPQGNEWKVGERQRIRFVLRGAPNEFLLNTNINVCGNVRCKVKQTDVDTATAVNYPTANYARHQYGPVKMNSPYHLFQSSRESFNAGSLPYLDNQDVTRSHVINTLRYACVRRNRLTKTNQADIQDLKGSFSALQQCLKVGFANRDETDYTCNTRILWKVLAQDGTGAGVIRAESFGKDRSFQIPLGTYSNFVNSHSVTPLGLCSSYAVNGWQIELETTEQTGRAGKCFSSDASIQEIDPTTGVPKVNAAGVFDGATYPLDLPELVMRDLRIYMPVVKILDPSVMASILSLYEKREQVSLGGVQFPLSMRVNSIGYRTASFPIQSNTSDYFFRLAGTDRSVRAVGWWIYNKQLLGASGRTALEGPVKVTRLETTIGNEHVHEVIEDTDNSTNNVSNFVNMNLRKSASVMSVLPYYQEGNKHDGQQEDDLDTYNNALSVQLNPGVLGGARLAVCYGMVSLENLDRREGDYSGSFQASGKDLTNAGAIEMRMRIQLAEAPIPAPPYSIDLLDQWKMGSIQDSNHEIVFVYAYDSVMEVSPQGVSEITNAVL